ncbi:hypothetical protein AALA83_13895 [Oscillospiraceae bacterium 44-5]
MKVFWNKRNLPYLYILVMVVICIIFGTTRALPIIGFNAVAVMFAISIVLSFLMRGALDAAPKQDEDNEDD